jgi:hypothetical protein
MFYYAAERIYFKSRAKTWSHAAPARCIIRSDEGMKNRINVLGTRRHPMRESAAILCKQRLP